MNENHELKKMREGYGDAVIDLAQKDEKVVFVGADSGGHERKWFFENAKERLIGIEYEQPLVYNFEEKEYSLNDLESIERFINEQQSNFSESKLISLQQELRHVMTIAQSDFLDFVEQFLINAKNNNTRWVCDVS